MKRLLQVWNGEVDLPQVFWNWAVAGGLVVNVASSIGFLVLVLQQQLLAAIIVGYAFSLPYNVLVTVGVWRSAERYRGEKRLADLAKLVTLIGMTLLSVT
ncbi:MAG: hypothetical protein ABJM29_14340 [Rhizobiaceae bacterium]